MGGAPEGMTSGDVDGAAAGPLDTGHLRWTPEGEADLARIPFFVRPKVRRNTETFAQERGLCAITEEVLYDAKAHYSRRS